MNRVIRFTLFFILIFNEVLFARAVVNDPLKIAIGPRYLSLGRACVGLADDVNAIFSNPAGLIQINSLQVTAMRANFLNDYTYTLVGAALPLPFGAVGLGYASDFAENIPKTVYADGQIIPDPEGKTFGGNDDCALISLAVGFKPWIAVGANAKYYKQVVDTNGRSGQAFDLGALVKLSYILSSFNDLKPLDDLTLGIVFSNIIRPKLKWSFDSDVQEIPSRLKLGLSARIKENFLLTTEYGIGGGRSTLHAGLEWWVSDQVALRIGADEGLANLTVGIGLKTGGVAEKKNLGGHDFEFDYAYRRCESPLDADGGHFFALSYLGPVKTVKKDFSPGIVPVVEETREKPTESFYETTGSTSPVLAPSEKTSVNFYGVDKSMLFSNFPAESSENIQPVSMKIKHSPVAVRRGRLWNIAIDIPAGIEINKIKVEFKDGGEIFLTRSEKAGEFRGTFSIPRAWKSGFHEAIVNVIASNAFFEPKVIKFQVL
jgi:hypothetical protein